VWCTLLKRAYSAFLIEPPSTPVRLNVIIKSEVPGSFPVLVELEGYGNTFADSDYEVLYYFEKSVTITLEGLRSELYFLHAAALEFDGVACLLVAASGSGKSTTAWAMLHNGFCYLSDELAPVELETLRVSPYPHALCLKSDPPSPFDLPKATIRTAYTLHVPVEQLPSETVRSSVPLAAAFFISYQPDATAPAIRAVTHGETTARLYANGLNQLAHSRYGMEAATRIGTGIAGFEMITANLQESADLLRETMRKVLSDGS